MLAVALLASALALIPSPIPASFHPTHFEITSSWRSGEMSYPPDPHPSGYVDFICDYQRALLNCMNGWIEDAWVERLLDAVRIPDERGQVRLAGYSDATVERIASELQVDIRGTPQWNAAERRAALSLATPSSVRAMIYGIFYPNGNVSVVLPGAPSVVVRLRDDRNRDVVIESNSKLDKMLPWRLSYDGRSVTFAHAAISTAVAAFLPPGEQNRQLLLSTLDPFDTLITNIDFRVIACMFNENPGDSKFCALTHASTTP
jgi:hypothetical protein